MHSDDTLGGGCLSRIAIIAFVKGENELGAAAVIGEYARTVKDIVVHDAVNCLLRADTVGVIDIARRFTAFCQACQLTSVLPGHVCPVIVAEGVADGVYVMVCPL